MITVQDGVVRLDDAGVAALLGGDELDLAVTPALDRAGLRPVMDTVRRPVVTLEVLVAGSSLQLHRVAVDAERAVVLLAVRPGLQQLMVLPPSHVAAALVRVTRTGPRRGSGSGRRRAAPSQAAARLLSVDADVRRDVLHEAGATLAWRLRVGWNGEHRDLVVVDGTDGPHVVDDGGALLPVSATTLYRVFSTALPPQALEQRT